MVFTKVVINLAVAVPFLFPPSCRSLHVMEDGHEPQETLIFGVHHKTGTVLARRASKCFDSSFKHKLDVHWKGQWLGAHERALHLTRNPISLALSAYIYHMETGEDWSLRPGGEMNRLAKDLYLQKFMINGSEPYTEFLRRVDARTGIRAEINRLSHEYAELHEMEVASRFCEAHSQCMQICFEDFTVSSSSYDASWRKVLNFMGTHGSPEMHQCLSKFDLNRNPVDSQHVTSNHFPEWRYSRLKSIIEEVDAAAFNSRLKKMAEGRLLHCGGYKSNLFHAQTDLNATGGSEYREWLREEEYSKA